MSVAIPIRRRGMPLGTWLMKPGVNWAVGLLGLALLLSIAIWVFRIAGDVHQFPINEVEVLGTLDYTDRNELRDLVTRQTGTGFYRLDIKQIHRDVTQLPWIAEAHIRRIWPDRLSIEVVEHEPAARWNDTGLISKKFELFYPPQLQKDNVQLAEWLLFFAQFPQLGGAAGRHEAVLGSYRTMQVYLGKFDVRIEALLEDERRSQTLALSNNVVVKLGVTDVEERIQRFISVYERLVTPLGGRTATFDMRYTNGFAMTTQEKK